MPTYPQGQVGFTPVVIIHNDEPVSDTNPLPVTGGGGGGGLSQAPTDTSTTGTVNNFSPTTAWIRYTGAGDLVITGIDSTGIVDGQEVVFYNTSTVAAGKITFNNNDAGSLAANRILTGSNLVVSRFDAARFKYNGTTTRWEIASSGNFKWTTSGNREPTGTYYLGTIAAGGTTTIQGFINSGQWLNLSSSVGTLDSTTYAAKSVDFRAHQLWFNGTKRYDWSTGLFYNSSGLNTFDPNANTIYNGIDNTVVADFTNYYFYSPYGAGISLDFNFCQLKNPTSLGVMYDWYTGIINDTSGVLSIDTGARGLCDLSGNLVCAYGGAKTLSFDEGSYIGFGTTTGTVIGTTVSEKFSFWGLTPVEQPAIGGYAATWTSVGGGAVEVNDTFDGWTIPEIVGALRTVGILQ